MIMKLVFTCLSKYDYETLNNFFYLSKYRLMKNSSIAGEVCKFFSFLLLKLLMK